MMDWSRAIDSVWSGLVATSPAEAVSVALGLAYAVLAIRRSRWCWATGGLSSAIMIYLSLNARLPMQAALQVYYVVISVYGWWHWTREEEAQGTLAVTTWPIRWHLAACAAVVTISALTAHWLATQTQACMAIPGLPHHLGQACTQRGSRRGSSSRTGFTGSSLIRC